MQSETAFLAALTSELERCAQIEDRIGLLTLTFDQQLSSQAREAMAEDVRELARAGDLVGSLDENTLAVAIPWTDPTDTLAVARAVEQLAGRHGTPHVHYATVAPQAHDTISDLLDALEPVSPARGIGAQQRVVGGRSRGA